MIKLWHWFGAVKTWQLIILFISLVLISSWLLRQNNLNMDRLRQEVLRIDQEGGDVSQALSNLGTYIFKHMNTDMGQPLELVSSYNRAVEAAQAATAESADGDIYAEAQAACERREIPLTARAQCIQEYVTTNAAPGQETSSLQLPPKDLFTYDFYSPVWTPDLAGWSVVLTLAAFILVVGRFIASKIVKAAIEN